MSEAQALIQRGLESAEEYVLPLLEEAFIGAAPTSDFRAAPDGAFGLDVAMVKAGKLPPATKATFLRILVALAGQMVPPTTPTPYWPARHGSPTVDQAFDACMRQWASFVGRLDALSAAREN